jgi:hypothetical protein
VQLYFLEDTTCAAVFRDLVSRTEWNIIRIIRCVFEKIVFVGGGRASIYWLDCSCSMGTDLWWIN